MILHRFGINVNVLFAQERWRVFLLELLFCGMLCVFKTAKINRNTWKFSGIKIPGQPGRVLEKLFSYIQRMNLVWAEYDSYLYDKHTMFYYDEWIDSSQSVTFNVRTPQWHIKWTNLNSIKWTKEKTVHQSMVVSMFSPLVISFSSMRSVTDRAGALPLYFAVIFQFGLLIFMFKQVIWGFEICAHVFHMCLIIITDNKMQNSET